MIKELEDYNWFPKIFRRFQLEYIGSIILWSRFYQPLVPVIKLLMKENDIHTVQDLCSGSGMPAVFMQQQLNGDCKTVLSDKFPEQSFIDSAPIQYLKKETDVLSLLPERNTCYTMYNAFHHFTAAEKKQIVQQFQNADAPFVIAEILQPGLLTLIKIILTTTVLQLLTAPFVQPFSLLRLLFTYIIPVNLFTVTYDGIISVLKSKSEKQYQLFIKKMGNDSYTITVDRYSSWKGAVICIKGNPKK
jgi:hypothetical protein